MGNNWYKFQFSDKESKKQSEFYQDFIDLYLYNPRALKFSLYRDTDAGKYTFYIACQDYPCDEKLILPFLESFNGIKIVNPVNTENLTLLFGKKNFSSVM